MEFRYDPDENQDPKEWLALDESEKLQAVLEYHRKKRTRLPNARMHAVIHVVVENQVALGEEIPARAALLRLRQEGLDRHEAVHAIGSVLSAHLFHLLKFKPQGADLNAKYYAELRRLTAESWRNSASDEPRT